MRGTGLAFIGILLGVLIAVAVGAQQLDAQKSKQIDELKQQRQILLDAAHEALAQRDNEIARAKALEDRILTLQQELDGKVNEVALKDAEISRLNEENRRQKEEIASLMKPIPVTNSTPPLPNQTRITTQEEQLGSETRSGLMQSCLSTQGDGKMKLMTILAILKSFILMEG